MQEYYFNGQTYYLKTEVDEQLRTIQLEGWKGKDKISIIHAKEDGRDVWVVKEHRKDKESGEVALGTHTIPDTDVEFMRKLIHARTENARKTRYRELAIDIITQKHLPIILEEFNGGKNRSKYYFPLYYYPIKILESWKEIRYGGRGTVVRLK